MPHDIQESCLNFSRHLETAVIIVIVTMALFAGMFTNVYANKRQNVNFAFLDTRLVWRSTFAIHEIYQLYK